MVDTAFTDALASKAPTPGGGGAAAYAGALAAALGSMVARLTSGKEKFAAQQPDIDAALAALDAARGALLELIDADAAAFSSLAATWKMPRGTEDELLARHRAEQDALDGACAVPLKIMDACVRVVEIDAYLARNSVHLALSDVGASAALAKAAVEAAALNVFINTTLMDDADKAMGLEARVDAVVEKAGLLADEVYAFVRDGVRRR